LAIGSLLDFSVELVIIKLRSNIGLVKANKFFLLL